MPEPLPPPLAPLRPVADPWQPSGHPLVSLQGITLIRRGKALLDNLTLDVPATGITAIMGPNGAGKSLLLRVIMGLVDPTAGSVRLHPRVADHLALVFQRPVLLRRSVRGNLDHALRIYRVPRRDRAARLSELLRLGGLASLADHPARRLSGGEQQRLAMVRALAARPRLLLMDEPTASLDPQSTLAIEWLTRTAVSDGARILLVTHDHGQAQRLADTVVFLHHGRVTETTPAGRFFTAPDSAEASAYLDGRLLL